MLDVLEARSSLLPTVPRSVRLCRVIGGGESLRDDQGEWDKVLARVMINLIINRYSVGNLWYISEKERERERERER